MKPARLARPAVVLILLGLASITGCSNGGGGGGGGGVMNPTGDSFDSGDMVQGRSFKFTFPTAGSIGYHCNHHPSMTGTVSVAAGQADSVLVSIVGTSALPGFSPSTAMIKPGGYVRWVNVDGALHTATSN